MIVPATDVSPPMTAIPTNEVEAEGSNVDVSKLPSRPAKRPPATPASAPASMNATSLVRAGDNPRAAAALSLSRTAIRERPNSLLRRRETMTAKMMKQTSAK